MVIVVTGVAGCGKTTVGRALAARFEIPFQEEDELRPSDSFRDQPVPSGRSSSTMHGLPAPPFRTDD